MEVNDINKVMLISVLMRTWLAYQNLEANVINMDYVDFNITWCYVFFWIMEAKNINKLMLILVFSTIFLEN